MSRKKRSEMISAIAIALFLPSITAATQAEDRADARLQLLQIAVAAANYRADHGNYPDELAALVPDDLPQLPVDRYHAKQFVYHREGDGYLLYCLGANGQDDGGSNEQMNVFKGESLPEPPEGASQTPTNKIPAGADDLSIRVPRPAFDWPKPAAK